MSSHNNKTKPVTFNYFKMIKDFKERKNDKNFNSHRVYCNNLSSYPNPNPNTNSDTQSLIHDNKFFPNISYRNNNSNRDTSLIQSFTQRELNSFGRTFGKMQKALHPFGKSTNNFDSMTGSCNKTKSFYNLKATGIKCKSKSISYSINSIIQREKEKFLKSILDYKLKKANHAISRNTLSQLEGTVRNGLRQKIDKSIKDEIAKDNKMMLDRYKKSQQEYFKQMVLISREKIKEITTKTNLLFKNMFPTYEEINTDDTYFKFKGHN